VFASRANPENIELFADLIAELFQSSPAFLPVIERTVWREIADSSTQFLVALLLDRGVIPPAHLIERAISAAKPSLSPELGFYFFPEWSTDDAFFDQYLEKSVTRFQAWDRIYTGQCELKVDGYELCGNDYEFFKEFRRKGQNHNPIAEILRNDDPEALSAVITERGLSVDMTVPLSLFDRRKQGKEKPVRLIEYSVLIGAMKCFKWLLTSGAAILPRVVKYSAMVGNQDIFQELFGRRIPMEPALLGAAKGHHFSVVKALHEQQHMPIRPKVFHAMCTYKLKGLYYVLTRNIPFKDIMADAAALKAEDEARVGHENILLIHFAQIDDRFAVNLLVGLDGLDPFLETNQPYSTALHAAAASNSVEALERLLLCSGSDVNFESHGETPLSIAARHNAIEAVKVLAATKGIDPNRRSGGLTPLMIACSAGSIAVCRSLLEIPGIDLTAKDDSVSLFCSWSSFPISKTALGYCEQSGSRACLEIINARLGGS
jgi:hypothetical protein